MPIGGDFFEKIQDRDTFVELIGLDFYDRSIEMGVEPHFNKGKALDAFFQWRQDLDRVEFVEEKIGKADHLKCAAHLIYWLRRSSPINEFAYEAGPDFDINDAANERIKFMLEYGREYLALDIGYRAAQVYETRVRGRKLPSDAFPLSSPLEDVPSNDFIRTAVHVLKLKNVSPHALFLVLKAVFLRP